MRGDGDVGGFLGRESGQTYCTNCEPDSDFPGFVFGSRVACERLIVDVGRLCVGLCPRSWRGIECGVFVFVKLRLGRLDRWRKNGESVVGQCICILVQRVKVFRSI